MRVSTMTVYRLIRDGELPAIRVGKHFRLRATDVDRFLASRTVNPADLQHHGDHHGDEEHKWRAG